MVKPLGRIDLAATLLKLISKTFKILVIDDDEICLSISCRMVTSQGSEVMSTKNPIEGLALAKDHWNDLNGIIVDNLMPNMNGI